MSTAKSQTVRQGPEKAKKWKCDSCSSTYNSPIRINAVMCVTCSQKAGRREKWMKPND